MLKKSANVKTLRTALQAEFDSDPVGFFRKFVMPLLPRETVVQADVTETILERRDFESAMEERDAIKEQLMVRALEEFREKEAKLSTHPGGNGQSTNNIEGQQK